VQKLNQRLPAVDPAPGEGVVEERLVEEGQPSSIENQDAL